MDLYHVSELGKVPFEAELMRIDDRLPNLHQIKVQPSPRMIPETKTQKEVIRLPERWPSKLKPKAEWIFGEHGSTASRSPTNVNYNNLEVSDQKKWREPLSFISKHMDQSHSSYLHRQQLIGIPCMELRHIFHNMSFGLMASNKYLYPFSSCNYIWSRLN
jgi:hypothetical protein